MRPYRLTHHRIDQDVPARTLGRGRPGKQIVHFPSLKNEGVIVCESRLRRISVFGLSMTGTWCPIGPNRKRCL